jgi:hypothetical protein
MLRGAIERRKARRKTRGECAHEISGVRPSNLPTGPGLKMLGSSGFSAGFYSLLSPPLQNCKEY